MQELIERIASEAVHVGGGIIKVDGFINHQVDAGLMRRIGEVFAERLGAAGAGTADNRVDRVLTAEVSGIAPALATAQALQVPMIYARKHPSKAMTDQYFQADAVSRTRGTRVALRVSKRYLKPGRVLLVDDFLATGSTLEALVEIVRQSGAELAGIGCVIEKPAEQGAARLQRPACPIVSLAKVLFDNDTLHVHA